jgi:DNA-binding protein YbaB
MSSGTTGILARFRPGRYGAWRTIIVWGGRVAGMNNLGDLVYYALDQVERVRQAQERLEHASAEGRSPDGLVVARTGPGGRLLDLRVDEAALRGGAERLAGSVQAAVEAAQAAYAVQAGEIMGGELGLPSGKVDSAHDRGLARIDELTEQLESLTRRLDR